ncbi:aldo/keto reductase [Pedobacter sp. MC2016-05]|uniref:aldo/keto reductase n=1 Tax=Pedobacter sp. MC2016-05 TaxID=2994474 RepID=UPI0022463B94|nr:aldo/keto reductase [Pedobacter sp. MC2016-05]MCX2475375.1 aldo/keto reductase [Pedobacter sp. MC2016-05]
MSSKPLKTINPDSTEIQIPKIVFGTSGLGNLYQSKSFESKKEIIKAVLQHSKDFAFFDTAGKYGAGLALEVLGQSLSELDIDPEKVIISNKLGWFRTELSSQEPTFEPGIWKDLKNDAIQKISYQGILECFEQGNRLLGKYHSQFVSVHDPDEYLLAAKNTEDYNLRYQDILQAYLALNELKAAGKVKAVGIGAKDWKTIERISLDVDLDWVMIANSLTVHSHPKELLDFLLLLNDRNITVINSAIFNGGFLTGSDFYNYRLVDGSDPFDLELLKWREDFFELCDKFSILPAEACYNFSTRYPGIRSIAMSTSKVEKVPVNIAMATVKVPEEFWKEMEQKGLINEK